MIEALNPAAVVLSSVSRPPRGVPEVHFPLANPSPTLRTSEAKIHVNDMPHTGGRFFKSGNNTMQPLGSPVTDPTSIFEFFRGSYGTELLTAAVAHFDLFGRLAKQPRTLAELQSDLKLAERPAIVLTTALRAMQLLTKNTAAQFELTAIAAEHLVRRPGI